MAVLAHALQLVGGWIAPLVIFFVKRQSRFVSFHALQVLFLQLIYAIVSGCLMVFFFLVQRHLAGDFLRASGQQRFLLQLSLYLRSSGSVSWESGLQPF